MNKKILIVILTLISFECMGQIRRDMQKLSQQFLQTDNGAGMGIDSVDKGSFTTFGGYYSDGDYHRAMEGSSNYGLSFNTERYDSFNDNLMMRGSFSFNFNREDNRKWSDAMFSYNSNPYIFGSDVAKRYELQDCKIEFDLYTAPLNSGFSLGLRSEYEVSDLSGNRDPRPRTNYIDIKVIPSLLYSFDSHSSIGVNAGYRLQKEKLLGLSTVQTYPNLMYYTMTGLDNCVGVNSGYNGFRRQFVSDYIIGGIQYSLRRGNIKYLLSLDCNYQWQNVWGDKKQTPGSYNAYQYTLYSNLQSSTKVSKNLFDLKLSYKDGGADEHLQELQSVLNPLTGISTQTWVTLYTYHNRYTVKEYSADLSWNYYSLKSKDEYNWRGGVDVGYDGFSNNYYLPSSYLKSKRIKGGVSFGIVAFEREKHQLELTLDGNGTYPINTDYLFASSSDYVNEVLLYDCNYYSKSVIDVEGGVNYSFLIKVKGRGCEGYFKVKGGYLTAMGSLKLWNISLQIGLLTF